MIYRLLLLTLIISSTGCSVIAAATGSPEPDFTRIVTGSSRTTIEQELGEPIESKSIPSGTQAVYSYKLGDEPAAGRALGYLALDIITLCLAEYILFPLEISNSGNAYEAIIDYDSNGTARNIIPKRSVAASQ